MNFSGKYQMQSQENFEAFMKAVGVPDYIIQMAKDIRVNTEIVQNGKHFKLTITAGPKVVQNKFTLGKECELEKGTGDKVKTVVKMEGGNKLVTTLENIKYVAEFNGDTMITTMSVGDVAFKTISKKI